MDTVVATMKAKDGCENLLREQLARLVAATREESGTRYYSVHEGRPGRFLVYERYLDNEALELHMQSSHLREAMTRFKELLAEDPEVELFQSLNSTPYYQTTVEGKELDVYELPIGEVRLVYAKTKKGILACGALHVMPLQKFGIAAARVRPIASASVRNLQDLLDGEVVEANEQAKSLGILEGMKGRTAIGLL